MTEKTYDISQLSQLSEVSERAIRFYTTKGLLPRPNGRGRRASYSDDHLKRLVLIKRLQDGHMPLSEIGRFIDVLDERERQAREAASRHGGLGGRLRLRVPRPDESSEDSSVFAEGPPGRDEPRWSFDPHAAADAVFQQVKGAAATAANIPTHLVPTRDRAAGAVNPAVGERSRWERIHLGPGMELLISSPRSKKKDAAVERFIELAREMFPNEAK